MSSIRGSSRHTVRPSGYRRLPKGLLVVVFVLAGVLVYWRGMVISERDKPQPQFTSTASVRIRAPQPVPGVQLDPSWLPRPDPDTLRQQMAAATGLPNAAGLRIEIGQGSALDEQKTSITYTDKLPDAAARTVNGLAQWYADACRNQWRSRAEQAYLDARDAMERVDRRHRDAKAGLERFYDRRPQTPQANVPPATDAPERLQVARQLAQLRQRRTEMLANRTPLHPGVQDVELRIRDLEDRLAQLPPRETPPVVVPPEQIGPAQGDAAELLRRLKDEVERAGRAADEAARAERQAWQARLYEPRMDVELAEAQALPPAQPALALVLAALMAGMATVTGVGMVWAGGALEPVLTTTAQVKAALRAPLVGVIPQSEPRRGRRANPVRQHIARWGLILAGLAVLGGGAAVAWCRFQ